MRLLVVDWDYFAPLVERPQDGKEWLLYDWGHSEVFPSDLSEMMWRIRAAGFVRHGVELPKTSGEEVDFWSRFRIRKSARFYVADSNVQAFHWRVQRGVDDVWLYDAHHDCGYTARSLDDVIKKGSVSCEDWMVGYGMLRAGLHVRYPKWRSYAMELEPSPIVAELDRQVDDGERVHLPFDKVFVCRSGGWTPPWLDEEFVRFVLRLNRRLRRAFVTLDGLAPREWDLALVDRMIEAESALGQAGKEATQ